jgi:hypothetical protein
MDMDGLFLGTFLHQLGRGHASQQFSFLQDGGEAVLMSCLMWVVGGPIG